MGCLLTVFFWSDLWLGAGFVGGDIYTYSLPQKQFLADALRDGEIPLWNPLVGQGYPVLGESQTGALYPPYLLLYRFLDVQTAWNAVLIGHYIAAFIGTVWCLHWLGLKRAGSLLGGLVYVYGWFPPRACLDWAIVGGLYLPLLIGCVEALFQTRQRRYALLGAAAVGLQLLAGHYQLAFLTWLLAGPFAIYRWRTARQVTTDVQSPALSYRITGLLIVSFLLGVGLAAVQLFPTWELKSRSQRTTIGGEYEPTYGHIPPLYLSQVVLPWVWFSPTMDQDAALAKLTWMAAPAATNRVEAHLYFGQIPFYLMLGGLAVRWRSGRPLGQGDLFWIAAGLCGVWYATGWPMAVLRNVPGFNFFRCPARAGLVTTFAVAVLSGRSLDALRAWSQRFLGPRTTPLSLLTLLVFAVTVADLWWFPRTVNYAVAIMNPPIQYLGQSQVRDLLKREPGSVRLYAPGANLPTLLGQSSLPVYLGLGPAEYFDAAHLFPPAEPDDFHTFTPARLEWLRNAGVTHVLSLKPLGGTEWPVEMLWIGMDPLLNRAWGRFDEPVYLYRLQGATGRLVWQQETGSPVTQVVEYSRHRVVVEATCSTANRLTLRDLHYPGWQVAVDGAIIPEPPHDGIHRAVELSAGRHQVIWTYQPWSVYWGGLVSGISLILLGVLAGTWSSWVIPRLKSS